MHTLMMTDRTILTRFGLRLGLVTALFAVLVLAAPRGAGAEQRTDSSTRAANLASACRMLGGTPTTTTIEYSDGSTSTIVYCDLGGYDLACTFLPDGAEHCEDRNKFAGRDENPIVEPGGIKPLDEPVKPADTVDQGLVDEPKDQAPVEQPTATPVQDQDGTVDEDAPIDPGTDQPDDQPVGGEGEDTAEPTATPTDADSQEQIIDAGKVDEPKEASDGTDEENVQLT